MSTPYETPPRAGTTGRSESIRDAIPDPEPIHGSPDTYAKGEVGSIGALISDISAGRTLRPDFKVAPMASTIQNSAAYLETEGRANHVGLVYEIDHEAPPTLHDELYVFRIVQNLVGNAIKAVKETVPEDWQMLEEDEESAIYGEVRIRYVYQDTRHVVEVHDTGPGMTRDIAERILSGTARSQWEKTGGSGWGTKIVLELAHTHAGAVSIDSELGQGSVFRVEFPHREG